MVGRSPHGQSENRYAIRYGKCSDFAHETELSQRAIARSLRISRESVRDYLIRASALNLRWPLPEDMDDATLEIKLFPTAAVQLMRKPDPDWATIHSQLKGKGRRSKSRTSKSMHKTIPKRLRLSQFCHRFRPGKDAQTISAPDAYGR